VAQNEQRSTSKRSSSSHVEKGQKMALVLVPANVELPTGSIALSAEVAARPLNTIVQGGTGPGEEPPEPYQKKYIEHWDSSMMQNTAQQAEQPAMGKKYIEHWDSSMMQNTAQQAEQPAMGKKYIEHWDSSMMQNTAQQAEQPAMGKKYIEHWDSSMMQNTAQQAEQPAMGKKYIDHWDSSMMQNTAQQADQPAMGKKYIEHWDSSMMQISAPKDQPERIMMAKRGPKEWELDLQPEPVMGRKFIDTEVKWEPQAKDQLIIVTTMAVMALLVGAISARRLRNRRGKGYGDWLSACIENNVEDELAYDAATTFSGAYSAVGGVYDTFSQVSGNGWRNELERFDV
jgi:predicted SnoaL-like aldol condensation-catalyzing enzyme